LAERAIVSHIRLEPTLRKAPASSESDSLYATAFDDAPHAMALLADDGSILHANRAFCNILGYSRLELRGRKLSVITHPDDRLAEAEERARLESSAVARYAVVQRCVRNDGAIVWVRLSVSSMGIGAGKPVNFVAQLDKLPPAYRYDNGDAGEAEATRFRDATLSAMHEIGNSLTPLMMNTEMLVEQTESSGSDISESARQIFKAARRIAFTLRRVCGIEDVQPAARLSESRVLDLRLLPPRPPASTEDSPPAA
jgi:PAS domain S-box-containing protein